MKKIIVIFAILAVVVGSVFAADPAANVGDKEEILVTCRVTGIAPTYQLFASLTNSTASNGTGMQEAEKVANINTAATAKLEAEDNAIIDGDLPVYCVIKQVNDARYTTNVTLTVAATKLSGTVNETTYETADPTIGTITAANNVDYARTTTPATASVGVEYTGKKALAADIASFTVTWPQTDLPPATYNAYITMTLTAI